MTIQQIMILSPRAVMTWWRIRRLKSRLLWCSRQIEMHKKTISNEQEIIRLRDREAINCRIQLRDLGEKV